MATIRRGYHTRRVHMRGKQRKRAYQVAYVHLRHRKMYREMESQRGPGGALAALRSPRRAKITAPLLHIPVLRGPSTAPLLPFVVQRAMRQEHKKRQHVRKPRRQESMPRTARRRRTTIPLGKVEAKVAKSRRVKKAVKVETKKVVHATLRHGFSRAHGYRYRTSSAPIRRRVYGRTGGRIGPESPRAYARRRNRVLAYLASRKTRRVVHHRRRRA